MSRLQIAQTLYARAQELSNQAEKTYREKTEKSKDGQYYLTMIKKGTQADKVSALVMMIQKNPQGSLNYLMQLLNMAKKPNRKVAETAILTIKDLLLQKELLPETTTTWHAFTKHPLILEKRESCSNEELLACHFEHCLREIVREFVSQVLQGLSHEELDHYRTLSLDILVDLLESAISADCL